MFVVNKLKTEPRCKICKHPMRDAIDELCLIRFQRGKDPVTGQRLTANLLLDILGSRFLLANPTIDNVNAHWGKERHSHAGAGDKLPGDNIPLLEESIARELAESFGDEPWTVDNYGRRVALIAGAVLQRELESGRLPRVTLEQGLKAVDTTTRRKQSDAQAELLNALTAGVAAAHGTTVDGEIEDADVEPAGEIGTGEGD